MTTTTSFRLAAAVASIAVTGGMLQAVFAIAAGAPHSQVVREAMAQRPATTNVAHRAQPAALPQFADASRYTR